MPGTFGTSKASPDRASEDDLWPGPSVCTPTVVSCQHARFRLSRGCASASGRNLHRTGDKFCHLFQVGRGGDVSRYSCPGMVPLGSNFPSLHRKHRTGDIWHAFLEGFEPGYCLCLPHRTALLAQKWLPWEWRSSPSCLIPMPVRSVGRNSWGHQPYPARYRHDVGLVVQNDFAWGADQPLRYPLADSIIYELHVRGFTRHPSARVQASRHVSRSRGKNSLSRRNLGVTAVELLPISDFEENDNPRHESSHWCTTEELIGAITPSPCLRRKPHTPPMRCLADRCKSFKPW